MRKIFLYLLLLLPLLEGCNSAAKKTNWKVTLNHEGKAPYDTWLTYETLPHYFPQAKRELISRSFRYTSIDHSMMEHTEDSVGMLVMTGLDYYVSDEEWEQVKLFARTGNEVLIVASTLDNKVEATLHCNKEGGQEELALSQFYDGTANQKILSIGADTSVRYGYTGHSLDGRFAFQGATNKDSIAAPDVDSATANINDYSSTTEPTQDAEAIAIGAPEVLGYANGKPNFIRYTVGNGHITLHAGPLVFSNYFLLQDGNRKYLDGVWHSFPANISSIYWNEYYKRSTEGSSMNVLWRYPATRWALIIAIITLLTYVLIGLKRRQRIIPIVRPLENASVSFVETIGRLYFNKGNHHNLAEKMIQHFLEWVRTYYFLDTSQLNDTFVQQLSSKSGQSEEGVRQLVKQIHDIRLTTFIPPEYLHKFYNTLQSFYNNQHR